MIVDVIAARFVASLFGRNRIERANVPLVCITRLMALLFNHFERSQTTNDGKTATEVLSL